MYDMSNTDTEGLKGTDRVRITCPKCAGTGIYQGPTGFHDSKGRPFCFECDGLGYRTVLVSSLRAAARREAKAAADAAAMNDRIAAEQEAFDAAHPGLRAWLAQYEGTAGFLGAAADKGERMTERMIETAERIRAEKAEAKAAATANPLPEGRRVLEGTVLSVHETFGDYGTTWKMTVQTAEGRVYGTIPAAIDEAVAMEHRLGGHFDEGYYFPLIGGTVRFTATVQRSATDPAFGYYSRPAKAELLARSAR